MPGPTRATLSISFIPRASLCPRTDLATGRRRAGRQYLAWTGLGDWSARTCRRFAYEETCLLGLKRRHVDTSAQSKCQPLGLPRRVSLFLPGRFVTFAT